MLLPGAITFIVNCAAEDEAGRVACLPALEEVLRAITILFNGAAEEHRKFSFHPLVQIPHLHGLKAAVYWERYFHQLHVCSKQTISLTTFTRPQYLNFYLLRLRHPLDSKKLWDL